MGKMIKTIVVLAVGIVLVGILSCSTPKAVTIMPAVPLPDLQMVQPDPSLPKELSAFFGKWLGPPGIIQVFIIVEKIDAEKASLCIWRSGTRGALMFPYWTRCEAQVIKEYGKYKLYFRDLSGGTKLSVKGE